MRSQNSRSNQAICAPVWNEVSKCIERQRQYSSEWIYLQFRKYMSALGSPNPIPEIWVISHQLHFGKSSCNWTLTANSWPNSFLSNNSHKAIWPIIPLFQGEPWQMLGCGVEFLCTQESYQCFTTAWKKSRRKSNKKSKLTSRRGRHGMSVFCQQYHPELLKEREEWNFVRKENLSLWEGFCKFILKQTRQQQSSPDLSLSKTKVREGKAGCLCCCCQSCQVISGCYLSFLLSEIHLIYL